MIIGQHRSKAVVRAITGGVYVIVYSTEFFGRWLGGGEVEALWFCERSEN